MSFKSLTVERLLLLSMIVISVGLVALQYKWTGDLARAEISMAQGILKNQAQSLCHVFDQQLSTSCVALVPNGNDISSVGFQAANLNRFNAWQGSRHRPLFSRIGVVVPVGDGLSAFLIDQRSRQLVPGDPPANWKGLLENLAQKHDGQSPPYTDPKGELFEYPVFGPNGESSGGPESQWTIMELNMDYVKGMWLPELLDQFLGVDVADVEIVSLQDPAQVLFSSGTHHANPAISIPFNQQGHSEGSPQGIKVAAWSLEVWPRTEKLEQAVARTRLQEFSLALVLDGLILGVVYMLLHYTRRARQLAEAQMNFVSATSHELRTPLTVIRGAAHNLQRGVVRDPARITDYAGLIMQNAEQLTRMIEQILEFAHAQRTRLQLKLSPVNIVAVIEQVVESLRQELDAAAIDLTFSTAKNPLILPGDEALLVRVFQNLVLNAIRHGASGKWIGIEIKEIREGNIAEITISDRGPGILEEELEKIFEPFYRGAVPVQNQTRGSGIGLGLVREIILSHRGTVRAENRPEGGAAFIVELPLGGSKKS